MESEKQIAALCLAGLIKQEDELGKQNCLNIIKERYGKEMKMIVEEMIKP